MSASRVLLMFSVMLVWTSGVSAEIQPSFKLHACAWHATDIVVVTEGEAIDGNVEVLEPWKGNLRRGDRITIPELAGFAPEKNRAVSKAWFSNDEVVPLVTSSRVALFLVRSEEHAGGVGTLWRPADRISSDMNVSIAWIENDQVFAFVQQVNPGPSQLISSGMSERQFRKVVDDIVAVQDAFTEAIGWNDAPSLASAVPPLLLIDSVYVRRFIIAALGDAGPNGVPAIRAILKDESLSNDREDAILALAKAGGPDAAPDITELLAQELVFWKKVGPGLKKDWWSGDGFEPDELNRLKIHYGTVYAAIGALRGMRFAGSREVVTALRKLWWSLPQLGSTGGGQVVRECDQLLAAL